MKEKISTPDRFFKTHRSYSPEEILAAGGTTAFGRKREKENQESLKALENGIPVEPFTDEEWDDLMNQLKKDK